MNKISVYAGDKPVRITRGIIKEKTQAGYLTTVELAAFLKAFPTVDPNLFTTPKDGKVTLKREALDIKNKAALKTLLEASSRAKQSTVPVLQKAGTEIINIWSSFASPSLPKIQPLINNSHYNI